jgi:hypothetical protein
MCESEEGSNKKGTIPERGVAVVAPVCDDRPDRPTEAH